jgi:hypothetical protein
MAETSWLQRTSPAFRLMIATSWLAPDAWQDKQEQTIRKALEADPDWAEYLRLVDRHRTPALSWAALKRVPGLGLPKPAKLELQRGSDACRMQAIHHVQLLAGILKAFSRANIPVMPLKGPLLSFDLYGDVGLRHSKDLDLVVAQQDIARARACLENLNWIPDPNVFFPVRPREWEIYWRNEHNLVFLHSSAPGHCVLELHWRNYREEEDQTRDRLARSIASAFHGCSYLAMNSVDQVLYLCSHGGEHAWFRAKWLGDLARIHADQSIDWGVALEEARRSNQERPLLAGLRLLKDVHGLPLPQLPGDPWKGFPAFLTDEHIRCLKVPEEFEARGALVQLRDQLRKSRHDRLLQPHTTWRQSLAALTFRREDFKEFSLPDSLFWAYAPLRPIFWAWRKMRRFSPGGH